MRTRWRRCDRRSSTSSPRPRGTSSTCCGTTRRRCAGRSTPSSARRWCRRSPAGSPTTTSGPGRSWPSRPGRGGIQPLHTDWTFVDESRYRTGLVWVALDDMTSRNGAIFVAAGTNRLDTGYTGHQIHYPYSDPEVRQAIDDRSVLLEIPAGQAIVWDNRVLHGSDENVTDGLRLAVGVAFRPRAAQLYHYRLMPDGQSHRYRVDPEFFADYEPFVDIDDMTGPHLFDDEVHPLPEWAPTPADLRSLGPVQPIHGAPRPKDPQPRWRRFFGRR
ncbi:phytanoyl-CoA dioxygenase family protein [Aquihabitans sp. G128]|uniref:phytanoyl-CoA dioxygenase family protein n=1 Tax=Aquihabitans sp. G128 TaxID=2849779 RepID=UPI0020B3C16E|nr:phytanoyl-CoA dioxygenase family protein [Aquihabitans sp. G128]